MKKFLFILILVIMLPFILCSCSSQKENSEDTTLNERFVTIESCYVTWANNAYSKIIVDKETKVMYYKYNDYYMGHYVSGITVLYNADGTPMIYEGEL